MKTEVRLWEALLHRTISYHWNLQDLVKLISSVNLSVRQHSSDILRFLCVVFLG